MKLDTSKASISVLGALNMDLIMNLNRPAKPGETVVGDKFYTAPGGKGGNQAVAAARVSNSESVSFLGFIGDDNYGSELLNYLIDFNTIEARTNCPENIATLERQTERQTN